MAYRIRLNISDRSLDRLRQAHGAVDQVFGPLVRDSLDLAKEYAAQNLSGVPFTSRTGTHTINKRTGKGVASLQVQAPYGSPFKGRLFASAKTRYANNPETYDYLAILEYGRGEIRPKYTPAARAGMQGRARLTIPGGGQQLVSGQNGFRGASGRYRFVGRIPPMEGKFWMAAAAESAGPDIAALANQRVERFLQDQGLK